MAQFGRPSTDTTRTNWEEDDGTTAAIWDQIDESVRDDADFIRTTVAPSSAVYVTKLTTLTDPLSSTGHILRYVYGKDSAGGATINQVVELRQGYVNESSQGTLIASATHNNVGAFPILTTLTLSGAEADAITDYSNLYVRIVGTQI